jgi:hypothetical protein
VVRVDVLEERRVKAGANALGLSRNDGKLVQAHETARANVFGGFAGSSSPYRYSGVQGKA